MTVEACGIGSGDARCNVTSYTVSALPESEDPYGGYAWSITVEYAGFDRWAVRHLSQCLSRDGEWDYEPLPSSREDDWLAAHRFDLDLALGLAAEHAPLIVVNGMKPVDVIAFAKSRGRLGEKVTDE